MRSFNHKVSYVFVLLVLFLGFFSGCSGGKKEAPENIKDIQAKEGVPVKIKSVAKETFIVSKKYSGTLRGREEAMASAAIGGNIEKILVKVGDKVKKDQVIAKFREDAASSQYRQARAAINSAEDNLKRVKSLYSAGAVSKQQLDGIETQYDVAKANFEASQKQIFVQAPISGYIGNIFVKEGDGVSDRQAIATITDLKDLTLKINLPEHDIIHISKNTSVSILSPVGESGSCKGKIIQTAITASPMTRNFEVEILVESCDFSLRSGMIVETVLNLIEKPNSFYVLTENVIRKDNEDFIYIIIDKRAKLIPI
jgi:RND family efflux transporter MFP subunit